MILVVVDNMPTKVPVSAAQDLLRVVRQDSPETLTLAKVVKVSLERRDMGIFLQAIKAVVTDI